MAENEGLELAKAYVQIIPTTKGIKKMLEESFEGEEIGKTTGKSVGANLLRGLGTVVSAAAVGKVISKAFSEGADLEQSIGGIETMFKDNADKVLDYANNAYKTAGVSANQYMQQVTSFSASLLSSMGGDTEKAAEVAHMAMVDMSDNANKFGSSIEGIQYAYQGFAKQNYTMLDNLKLGYGGTKAEMERLLEDAQKISGVEYDISNLSDVYNAVHVIQAELGVAGTTVKEAEDTFSGSFGSMKAAANNFLGTLTNGGDISKAFDDMTDSSKTFSDNFMRMANTMFLQLKELPYSIGEGFGLTEKQVDALQSAAQGLLTTVVAIKAVSSFDSLLKSANAGLETMNIKEAALLAKTKLVSGEFLAQNASALKIGGAIAAAAVAGELLKTAIDNATDKIDEVGDKYAGLTQQQRDFVDAIDASSLAISEHINDRKGDLSDIDKTTESYRDTAAALYELDKQEILSAEDKQTMLAMVNSLNDGIEGLNITIDEETGHLKTQKSAVDELIDSMEKKRKLDLMSEEIPEMISDHKKAVEADTKALEEYNKAVADRDATKQALADLKRWGELHTINSNSRMSLTDKEQKQYEKLSKSVNNVIKEYGSYDSAFSALNKDLDAQNNAVGATAGSFTQAREALRELENQMTGLGVTGVDYVMKTTNFADASKAAVGDLASVTQAAFGDIKDSYKAFVDVTYSLGGNVYTVSRETADGIKEIQTAYRETVQQTTDDLYASMNVFEEFPKKADVSAQTLIENMNSNLEGVKTWGENMDYLVEHGVSEGLISKLRGMGFDSASYVQAMTEMTDPELQKYSESFDTVYGECEDAAESSLGNVRKESAEQIQALINQTQGQQAKVEDAFDILGGYCGVGFAAGIRRETERSVKPAARQMSDVAVRETQDDLDMHSPSRVFSSLGGYVSKGFALGIKNNAVLAQSAAADMTQSVTKAASNIQTDMEIEYGKAYRTVNSVARVNTARNSTIEPTANGTGQTFPQKAVTQFIIDNRVVAEVMLPIMDVLQGTKVELTRRGVATV